MMVDLENSKTLSIRKRTKYGVEYVVQSDEGLYVVERTGECSENCAGCCKAFILPSEPNHFLSQFCHKNKSGKSFLKMRCNNLDKNDRCKIYLSNKKPKVCENFPSPTDPMYHHLKDECTYKFKVLRKI